MLPAFDSARLARALRQTGAALLATLALGGCDRAGNPLGPDLISDNRLGAAVYTITSFDGQNADDTFTFGPPGSIPVLGVTEGAVGQGQSVAVTTPGAGGYAGGFGYARLGGFAVDEGTTLNLFVRPDAEDTFTLGIRIQDDDNGDGVITRNSADAIVADDEFAVDLVIRPGDGYQRIASVPLSALVDLNPGVGNDVFDPVLPGQGGNGGFVSIAFILLETPGSSRIEFALDEITFNSDDTDPRLSADPTALTFSARTGQTSAPQQITVDAFNLETAPTVTVSDGFTATLASQTGTPGQGTYVYDVAFVAPGAAGDVTGTFTARAGGETVTVALTGTATSGPGTTRAYATFEDGDFGDVIIFSERNAGIGIEPVGGAPETGGQTALRFSLTPASAGTFAGFVIPPDGTRPFDASGLGFFSFYLRTSVVQANTPLTLEINLHEDANGNGAYDGATDDEFQATVAVQPGAEWRLVTIPLSAFADDNAVFPGSNDGFDYTRLFEVVVAIAGPTGPAYTLDIDDLRFTQFSP